MDHYIDIILLSGPEFPATVLINSLYTKLHKALYDRCANNIGVSFPKYKVTLGKVLRIHGTKSDLTDLQIQKWIGGMKGYCTVREINPVPATTKFRTVSRKQTTMSESKLQRLMKRGSISEAEIKQYRAKMFTKRLDNPYVELVSNSNGQLHRRYIKFGELLDGPISGKFDSFGLSKTATVPWF